MLGVERGGFSARLVAPPSEFAIAAGPRLGPILIPLFPGFPFQFGASGLFYDPFLLVLEIAARDRAVELDPQGLQLSAPEFASPVKPHLVERWTDEGEGRRHLEELSRFDPVSIEPGRTGELWIWFRGLRGGWLSKEADSIEVTMSGVRVGGEAQAPERVELRRFSDLVICDWPDP